MGGFAPTPTAAPTIITGYRDPSQTVDMRVKRDVSEEIIFLEPKAAPLTAISGALRRKEKATQYRKDWLQKDPLPRIVIVSGAQTAGDVTIETVSGHELRIAADTVLLNLRTREQVLATAIGSAQFTAVRGIGTQTAAMNDGDELLILGRVRPDASTAGTIKTTQETDHYNFCEILETPYGWSGRQVNTDLYGGSDRDSERRAAAVEHMKSIEYRFLFGGRHSRTHSNGYLQTFMGGLEYYIESNILNVGATEPTMRTFLEWMEYVMSYGKGGNLFGSGTKWLFCSNRILSMIAGWKWDKMELVKADKDLDIDVVSITTPHGTLNLVREPLLAMGEHGGWAFLLDMNHIAYVFHQGRDTHVAEDLQANDEDAEKEGYRSDVCIKVEQERAHGIFKMDV